MKSLSVRFFPLIAFLLCDCAFAQFYTAIPLNAGRQVFVEGINNSGTSVGSAGISPRYAYRWTSGGTVQGLGDLGGKFTEALAVNNLGQIVGEGTLAKDNPPYHAFLWTSGSMRDLGTLGDGNSIATAINDTSQVVGVAIQSNGQIRAFLWTEADGMQDLGDLGGTTSRANGINTAGHVVGSSTHADGHAHAFFWTAQSGMTELDLGPTTGSSASAINDSDQVVGNFINSQDGQDHAFLWDPSTGMHDLGTLSGGVSQASYAAAINSAGDVVGNSWILKAGKTRVSNFSVIWKHGGPIQKLGPLVVAKSAGMLPRGATGINTSGQIVANGAGSWLLTPQ